jgi:hypothetical protein
LLALFSGLVFFKKLRPNSRFFLVSFFFLILWSVGFFLGALDYLHFPSPAFLEPAKCWVLINVLELIAVGLILEDIFPKPSRWKWTVLALGTLNLLWPVWNHPLEQNLIPPNMATNPEAQKILTRLGSSRLLVLPNAEEHQRLYTPLPDPKKEPLFKHFIPNSNLLASLPVATFYGSTQPTWGALDAGFYFRYKFPYDKGKLLDLLGVGYLYLPESRMPSSFKAIENDDGWTLWETQKSSLPMNESFYFCGEPQTASRKEIFQAFASGAADPAKNLFLGPQPISLAPKRHDDHFMDSLDDSRHFLETKLKNHDSAYLIVRENAIPGWRAWTNGGNPTDIYLADGIFLCVPLFSSKTSSPKAHEAFKNQSVVLRYEPASFRFGLFLSLLSLAGFAGSMGVKKLGGLDF